MCEKERERECVCMCVCVCVCVCVRKRERERERECVCERERERVFPVIAYQCSVMFHFSVRKLRGSPSVIGGGGGGGRIVSEVQCKRKTLFELQSML